MPSLSGLNILEHAVTRKDGLAIDVFYVEVENSGLVEDKKPRICVNKYQILSQKQSSEDDFFTELRKKSKHNRIFSNHEKLGNIPSQVDVYRDINLGRTIVEVKAPDQIFTYLLKQYPNVQY